MLTVRWRAENSHKHDLTLKLTRVGVRLSRMIPNVQRCLFKRYKCVYPSKPSGNYMHHHVPQHRKLCIIWKRCLVITVITVILSHVRTMYWFFHRKHMLFPVKSGLNSGNYMHHHIPQHRKLCIIWKRCLVITVINSYFIPCTNHVLVFPSEVHVPCEVRTEQYM